MLGCKSECACACRFFARWLTVWGMGFAAPMDRRRTKPTTTRLKDHPDDRTSDLTTAQQTDRHTDHTDAPRRRLEGDPQKLSLLCAAERRREPEQASTACPQEARSAPESWSQQALQALQAWNRKAWHARFLSLRAARHMHQSAAQTEKTRPTPRSSPIPLVPARSQARVALQVRSVGPRWQPPSAAPSCPSCSSCPTSGYWMSTYMRAWNGWLQCGTHHAPCIMQHHAPCGTQHAPCTMRHTTRITHHASCIMCHTACDMQRAPFDD